MQAQPPGGMPRPLDETKVPWRVLLRHARPEARRLAIAVTLAVVITLVSLATPLAVQEVLDRVTASEPIGPVVLVIVGLFVAEALLGAVQSFLLGRSGEGIVRAMRGALIHRLLRWPMPAYDRHRAGDLLSRVNADTSQVRGALAASLTETLSGVLTFAGALLLMLVIDPLMLALTLACVVVATVAVFGVSIRVMAVTIEAQRRLGRLSAGLERALRAIRTVKLSGAERREEQELLEEADGVFRAGVRMAKLEALIQPVTSIAVQGALVMVLGVGGARLAAGTMELGALVAFLLYLLYLVVPVATLFMSITDLQAGRAALARVEEVLRQPLEGEALGAEAHDGAGAVPAVGVAGRNAPDIAFSGVHFSYEGRDAVPVLVDVSLEVPPGGRIALVGPSGAGKSTVFALIERFYDADAGTIAVCGHDVRSWPLRALRELIGHVEQDAPVMAGTLRSNLVYARPDASERELAEVVESANLASFVAALPDGLDTQVGDGGVLLSGGERQRVAIARMLLKRPRILLLDEVTSQMDGRNERLLKVALDAVARTCTTIVIAHRLSTVRDSDGIIVLDGGRVRACGTHDVLMERDALYAELATTQLADAPQSRPGLGEIRLEGVAS